MNFAFDFPFYFLVGVYVAQVGLTSFYKPWRMRRYYVRLAELYPPAEYPRLYPESPEALNRRRTILRRLDAFIGIVGLVAILSSLLFWDKDMTNPGPRDLLHPIVANGLFLSLMLRRTLWAPQFKRADPFISHDDLLRLRRQRMRMLFLGCGICALFFLFIAAARVGSLGFEPNISYMFVLLCLFFIAQSLLLARYLTRMLDQTDFSVYRGSHSPTGI